MHEWCLDVLLHGRQQGRQAFLSSLAISHMSAYWGGSTKVEDSICLQTTVIETYTYILYKGGKLSNLVYFAGFYGR